MFLDKSNFVTFPINANIPNNNDVTANTYIIDVISYTTNTNDKDNPVVNE